MISKLLEASFDRNSDKDAVVFASTDARLSYEKLRMLASHLNTNLCTLSPATLVIRLPKSEAFYAAVVSCLIYGRDFCCIADDLPEQRFEEIVLLFDGAIILHDGARELNDLSSNAIAISTEVAFSETSAASPVSTQRTDPYYYISTSGSTGLPKLVQGRQNALAPFVKWAVDFYNVNESTRWAQYSSVGFDLTLVDIVTTLTKGGCLVSLDSDFDRLRPTYSIQRLRITHWHSVPSAIPALSSKELDPEAQKPSVFSFCGEPLYKEDIERLWSLFPEARVVNTYGPTEGTLFCMAHEVDKGDLTYQTMPLGKPVPGWNILLDPREGYDEFECVLVSRHLAAGYVGDEQGGFGDMSRGEETEGFYLTGDILRLCDGKLFFARRTDRMVKIKGVRIELGEIEAAARQSGAANPVAFVDGKNLHLAFEESPTITTGEELSSRLKNCLPRSKLPSIISCVEQLPRLLNGKIDLRTTAETLRRQSNE